MEDEGKINSKRKDDGDELSDYMVGLFGNNEYENADF